MSEICENEREQIAETSRLSEAVRTLATTLVKQGEKLDRIADTSARNSAQLDALNEKADTTATKVDGLTATVGTLSTDVAVCLTQKETVDGLKDDVAGLKTSTAVTAGKVTGIATMLTLAANYVAPYIFGRP